MKAFWRYMTPGDWVVVLGLLSVALIGIAMVAARPPGSRVVVLADGQICFTADIDQYQSVEIDGPLGPTTLVIDDKGARITSSPCPRKICIGMGPARESADLIACVPNHILVRIDSADSQEKPYDLLSR